MNILRDPILDEREFGRAAVRVDLLCKWVEQSGAMLPPSMPNVLDFEAVHLESLLTAFYHGAHQKMSDDAVIAAAVAFMNDASAPPPDPKVREMISKQDDARLARWFVGSSVQGVWRRRLEAAIAAGELRTIDAQTGFPMPSVRGQPQARTIDAPAVAASHQGHTTKTAQRDEADVFIDAALEAVKPSTDVAAVWSMLQRMADAKEKPSTLLGADDKGLNYVKNGTDAWMNREALSKRLKRRQTP